MPCSKMGTTAVSRYWRMGSAVTSSLFWVSNRLMRVLTEASQGS